MHPLLRRATWCALVALLLGCVASSALVPPTQVVRTDAFRAPLLRAGGVAVIGLTEDAPDVDARSQVRFASVLAHTCKRWLPGLTVYGPASLRDEDEAVLRDFAAREPVDPARRDDMRRRVYGARFLLAARVLGNEVVHAEAESDDEVNYCSARALTVRYRLIDLEQGSLAYGATHRQREQECRRNARFRSGGEDGIGAAIFGALLAASLNATVDAVKGTYPAAPDSARLLELASREFVSEWPGAEEPAPGTGH